jgi:hypothetical protein
MRKVCSVLLSIFLPICSGDSMIERQKYVGAPHGPPMFQKKGFGTARLRRP